MAGKQNHPLKTDGVWDVDKVSAVVLPRLAESDLTTALASGVEIDGVKRGLPSVSQWFRMEESRPEIREHRAHARKNRAELLVDEALAIVDAVPPTTDRGAIDSGAVRHAESRANMRKWIAERLDRDTYGQRVDVDVNVHGEIDIVSVLQEARGRVIQGVVERPAIEQDTDDDGLDLVG